jgi:hypothetical protein
LKELWTKPILRSADAIDGLFHDAVVICESYADAKFYESLAIGIRPSEQPIDLAFLQAGGKGEIATLAKTYRALNVPTAAVADLDLLRNEGELEKLVAVMGGNFDELRSSYRRVRDSLAAVPARLSKADFLARMRTQLDAIQNDGTNIISGPLRKGLVDTIDEAVNWSEAKKYGMDKLVGQQHQDAALLLGSLDALGIFLIRRGELESWWRGGPADKNQWFADVMSRIDSADLDDARKFVSRVCTHLDKTR